MGLTLEPHYRKVFVEKSCYLDFLSNYLGSLLFGNVLIEDDTDLETPFKMSTREMSEYKM